MRTRSTVWLIGLIAALMLSACSTGESSKQEQEQGLIKNPNEHPLPIYQCDSLSARTKNGKRIVEYSVEYSAYSAASLTAITYDFGDGQEETISPANHDVVRHSYEEAGTYTTTVTLKFTVEDNSRPFEPESKCSDTFIID